ncbi:MAG: hypothetical protein HOY79_36655 [Streptomyces sp.]|nr:hypothetical protein [Streptomyces sp.]
MPTVSAVLTALPDPVDHPVFCGLTAQEVPEAQRPPLEAYRAKYDGMPTYSVVLAALPDLTDHPVLRLRRRN